MNDSVADAYCRRLARRHYENFSVASLFLRPELRLHLARIYAFCRTTDDLGDESGTRSLALGHVHSVTERASGNDAVPRLLLWRDQVARYFEDRCEPIHPVLLALSRTIERFNLPPQPFLDLIDANLQDQTVTEYENWEELRDYCMRSAAPVGRMVLKVFGIEEPGAERLSDDVCIGLQLANFAQDVGVDRAKGRTYLIQSELRRHGLEGAVRLMCDRAEALLASGRELEQRSGPGWPVAPLPLRLQLALYRLGGNAIIAEIRRAGYATERQRPHVTRLNKVKLVPIALVQCRGSALCLP